MTLPYSFGQGTPYDANFMAQLQADLDAIQASVATFTAFMATFTSGTWTPVLTFDTPGNLAVAYTTQDGIYTTANKLTLAAFTIITSSFTFTTASGLLHVTGLPFAASSGALTNIRGTTSWAGITKAGYTAVTPYVTGGTTVMTFKVSGSGQPSDDVKATDTPSGGTMDIRGAILYSTA